MDNRFPGAKFHLGQIVATQGAAAALAPIEENVYQYLLRHAQGDWGAVDTDDAAENDFSLHNDLRLLSVYTHSDGTRIWIITEADRSATTILLPGEY